jgi:hypothetical protein
MRARTRRRETAMSGHNGCPNDDNDYERGVREERARIVIRLRARATSEDVTADRWAQGGDDRMVALHHKAAEVLRSEASGIEGGYTVDDDPEKRARVRERFGMEPTSAAHDPFISGGVAFERTGVPTKKEPAG